MESSKCARHKVGNSIWIRPVLKDNKQIECDIKHFDVDVLMLSTSGDKH